MQPFLLDGAAYDLRVTGLSRKFSLPDSELAGRTLDGRMYRDVPGAFCHYTLTLEPSPGDPRGLDALWEALARTAGPHSCTFPYGQGTLTQQMFVTGGQQQLVHLDGNTVTWGPLTVEFLAMAPRVTP